MSLPSSPDHLRAHSLDDALSATSPAHQCLPKPSANILRRDITAGSREFARVHPDGSLHVWLPVELAQEVHDKKWGGLHPWVERDGFWDGVVLLYTPDDADELDITWRIIVEGFNYVTGQSVQPGAFG